MQPQTGKRSSRFLSRDDWRVTMRIQRTSLTCLVPRDRNPTWTGLTERHFIISYWTIKEAKSKMDFGVRKS